MRENFNVVYIVLFESVTLFFQRISEKIGHNEYDQGQNQTP